MFIFTRKYKQKIKRIYATNIRFRIVQCDLSDQSECIQKGFCSCILSRTISRIVLEIQGSYALEKLN